MDNRVKISMLRFLCVPEMGGVCAMKIPTDIHDDASSDGQRYDRVHGQFRQSRNHLQIENDQGHQQNHDEESVEFVSPNDWWRLLLPNPWMEVRRH
jgi:hypothetical protein